jgi:PAT family beta-lactamase induction signal transducer AmpG
MALVLVFIKSVWANSVFMDGFIIIYRLFNAFAKIGVFAIAMQCCSKNVSASQFTLYMTFGATGSIAGAALIGPIKDNFSWEISFLFFAGFLALAWLVLTVLNIDQQIEKISDLEKKHMEHDVVKVNSL